jgi:hypothetical protein
VSDWQITAIRGRFDEAREPELRELLARKQWALWATLYVDSGRPNGAWTWGARGRIGEEVAALLGGPLYLTASGPTPEAVVAGDSGVGELWGIAHALRAALAAWPWLAGAGVRCDNAEAVAALGKQATQCRKGLRPALAVIRGLPQGFAIRGHHVRGHGRAAEPQQRAWNAQADRLAARVREPER